MKHIYRRAGIVAVAAVISAAPAAAQVSERGPAFFARNRTVSPTGEDLSVSVDLVEAYDQDVSKSVADIAPTLFQGSGLYTMLTPQLTFQTRGGHVQFATTAG